MLIPEPMWLYRRGQESKCLHSSQREHIHSHGYHPNCSRPKKRICRGQGELQLPLKICNILTSLLFQSLRNCSLILIFALVDDFNVKLKVEAVEAQRKKDEWPKRRRRKISRRLKAEEKRPVGRAQAQIGTRGEDQTTRTARESSHLDFHSEKKKTEIANQLALNSNA